MKTTKNMYIHTQRKTKKNKKLGNNEQEGKIKIRKKEKKTMEKIIKNTYKHTNTKNIVK